MVTLPWNSSGIASTAQISGSNMDDLKAQEEIIWLAVAVPNPSMKSPIWNQWDFPAPLETLVTWDHRARSVLERCWKKSTDGLFDRRSEGYISPRSLAARPCWNNLTAGISRLPVVDDKELKNPTTVVGSSTCSNHAQIMLKWSWFKLNALRYFHTLRAASSCIALGHGQHGCSALFRRDSDVQQPSLCGTSGISLSESSRESIAINSESHQFLWTYWWYHLEPSPSNQLSNTSIFSYLNLNFR